MPTVRPQAPQKKTYGQSRSAAALALCMHAFIPGFNCKPFMPLLQPFVVHSCMHSSVCPPLSAKQPIRFTWSQASLPPAQVCSVQPCPCLCPSALGHIQAPRASSPLQVSTLNFVDLAGSERSTLAAKDDGDNKLRQTEGSAINKSLLTLGNVIRGLGDGRVSHTPPC